MYLISLVMLSVLLGVWSPGVFAAAPVVTAGPDMTRALPLTTFTLFGRATDADQNPLTVTWTQTSGPSATLDAPWNPITTVTLTTAGTYVFQIAADDGTTVSTDSTTVILNSTQTAFYVDPTYTGSTQTGAAATPWKGLFIGDADFTAKWNTINSALASNDVIIYFSARQAGSDVSEVVTGQLLWIGRMCRARISSPNISLSLCATADTTTRQLTLDGMSQYNTNDATPSWSAYGGTNRFKINGGSSSIAIGWGDHLLRDHITVRGFELTGSQSGLWGGGSDLTYDNVWIHDHTLVSPAFLLDNNITDHPDCTPVGPVQYVTIRNMRLERTIGEALYIGGTYYQTTDGGCPKPTFNPPPLSDLLIENNIVDQAGLNGDQGDGIDLKIGWQYYAVRKNTVTRSLADGFTFSGSWLDQEPFHYLIEHNVVANSGENGIALYTYQGAIRQNLIYDNASTGLRISGSCPLSPPYESGAVWIVNNTIVNNAGGGIVLSCFDQPIHIRNNVVVGNDTSLQIIDAGDTQNTVTSNYNLLAPAGSSYTEGAQSIIQASTTGIFVNAPADDYHLSATSPAKNTGQNLSLRTNLPTTAAEPHTFAVDREGTPRPQGVGWDMGMDEVTESGGGGSTTVIRVIR